MNILNLYNYMQPEFISLYFNILYNYFFKIHTETFNFNSTRLSNSNLYGFLDTGRALGLNTSLAYRRTIHARFFVNLSATYSRQRDELNPFFANRRNIAAEAGITTLAEEALARVPALQ